MRWHFASCVYLHTAQSTSTRTSSTRASLGARAADGENPQRGPHRSPGSSWPRSQPQRLASASSSPSISTYACAVAAVASTDLDRSPPRMAASAGGAGAESGAACAIAASAGGTPSMCSAEHAESALPTPEMPMSVEDTPLRVCDTEIVLMAPSPGRDSSDSAASAAGPAAAASFVAPLIGWYRQSRRRLPWRGDPPPYAGSAASTLPLPPPPTSPSPANRAYGTLVSELMLQQTRVATVIPHWLRWMARWPTATSLASASEAEVISQWAGLGYYRRARFLHAAAQAIVASHGGKVPSSVSLLKTLPGVGDYTAGAVASIAFGLRVPLVDGNVVRVLCRWLRWPNCDPKAPSTMKAAWAAAAPFIAALPSDAEWSSSHAGTVGSGSVAGVWNQALMELGATICTPTLPACHACPVRSICGAHREAVTTATGAVAAGAGAADGGLAASHATPAASASSAAAVSVMVPAAKRLRAVAPSPSAVGAATDAGDDDVMIEEVDGDIEDLVRPGASPGAASSASSHLRQCTMAVYFRRGGRAADRTPFHAHDAPLAPGASSAAHRSPATSAGDADAGSSGSAGPAASQADAAMSAYIASRYPVKVPKKAVPTLQLIAVALVQASETGGGDGAVPAAITGRRGSSIHAPQWSVLLHQRSDGAGLAMLSTGPNTDEVAAGASEAPPAAGVGQKRKRGTEEGGSAAAVMRMSKAPSRLLEGQWQPVIVPLSAVAPGAVAESSSGSDDGSDDSDEEGAAAGGSKRRGRGAAVSAAALTTFDLAHPALLAAAGMVLNAQLGHASAATASSSCAAWSLLRAHDAGVVAHTFSHVIHHIRVVVWQVQQLAAMEAGSASGAAAVTAPPHRWVPLSGAALQDVGLSTWCHKLVAAAAKTLAPGAAASKRAPAKSRRGAAAVAGH